MWPLPSTAGRAGGRGTLLSLVKCTTAVFLPLLSLPNFSRLSCPLLQLAEREGEDGEARYLFLVCASQLNSSTLHLNLLCFTSTAGGAGGGGRRPALPRDVTHHFLSSFHQICDHHFLNCSWRSERARTARRATL